MELRPLAESLKGGNGGRLARRGGVRTWQDQSSSGTWWAHPGSGRAAQRSHPILRFASSHPHRSPA